MKLIVGLGNCGNQYENTRHNVGFMALDNIIKSLNVEIDSKGFYSDYTIVKINNDDVMFTKPTTLMNLSGNCVCDIMNFYKIPARNVILIHDDMDLEVGKYKIRTNCSSGGHNGVKDIIKKTNSTDFIHFKIGIGHPTNKISVIDHVLGKFKKNEIILLKKPFDKCAFFVKLFLCTNLQQAISQTNKEDE